MIMKVAFPASTSRTSRRFLGSVIVPFTLTIVACTDSSTEPLVASAIGIVTGNGQTAVAGAQVANPFVVEVLDQNAEGMRNVLVNWTIVTGGGTLSSTASATDSTGVTSTRYTAGPTPGTATVRAAVNGIPNPVIFTVTITPGTASSCETAGAGNERRNCVSEGLASSHDKWRSARVQGPAPRS